MTEPVRLHLVRHGQTDLNRDKRFRGLSGAPLNGRGRREAAGAGATLSGSRVTLIRSSPVPRALETAGIIGDSIGARIVSDDGFTDIDYGKWQGLTVEEVAERFGPSAIESWRRDPGSFVFPDGDSMRDVRERLGEAVRRAVSGGEESVAVVSHLAVIKICFLVTMELPFEYFWKTDIENGSVSRFAYTPERGFLLEWWNREPDVGPT